MKRLIQIGKFQIGQDGLLLISEANGFPFLVINSEGVTFDAGPFTGTFCNLKGLSKFTVHRETNTENSACTVKLTFAEGDSYPIGGFDYRESLYREALCWAEKANQKIALKTKADRKDSVGRAQDADIFVAVNA